MANFIINLLAEILQPSSQLSRSKYILSAIWVKQRLAKRSCIGSFEVPAGFMRMDYGWRARALVSKQASSSIAREQSRSFLT